MVVDGFRFRVFHKPFSGQYLTKDQRIMESRYLLHSLLAMQLALKATNTRVDHVLLSAASASLRKDPWRVYT